MRDATSDVGDVGVLPSRRDEAIAKLAEKIGARARARRRNAIVASLAVAAGVLAIVGGSVVFARRSSAALTTETDLGHLRDSSGVTVVSDGHVGSVAADERVSEGAELRTATGSEARLDFESGTRLTIAGGTRVRLVEQRKKKRFALESGSVFAKVAKLAPDDRFVVATPDAEVEVRGTAFRVSLVTPEPSCGAGTPTRLEVVEGVVVVRHAGGESRVSAGESWPSCTARAVAVEPPVVVSVPAPVPATPQVHPSSAPPASSSHLSAQNDMFDEAMRERREGHGDAAISTLDRLLKTYPNGPLAENATVEQMRILAGSDRGRAGQIARDYLHRWPRGFARTEAEALAGSP